MKLLLIGIDAADWSLIRPLLEQGLMPRLQRLLSNAVIGELQLVRPFDAAALWTSVVTGMRAMRHGVLNAVEADLEHACIRPATSWTRTAWPVWSLLSQAGLRTHAFGWPASHPAEPINGVTVSDQFADQGLQGSVCPSRLMETLADLRLGPTEIDIASLLTLLPRAGELNPAGDRRLYAVAQFLAGTASLHAAATWTLEHEPWDFAAVRYAGFGRLDSIFGQALAAAEVGERSEDAELFGDLIPNAYRFFDMLLGRLLELAGVDASVVLVSQHGRAGASISTAMRCGLRPAPGLFIAAGPGFQRDRQLTQASVCDVAPTILRLFRVRTDVKFDGRALDEALRDRGAAGGADQRLCDGVEGRADDPPVHCDAKSWSLDDDSSVALLLALGYHEPPDPFLQIAIAELEQERLWRLAESWIDCEQFEQAARVLEDLVRLAPSSIGYRSALAEAQLRAGEYGACREMIESLASEGVDTALARVGLAALDVLDGASEAAVTQLRRAESIGGATAVLLEVIGRLYLGLRRRGDAARAFAAAVEADPARATAHEGRAMTCLLSSDAPGAERHARQAIKLNPTSYDARCHLGLALARQDRVEEAIAALREAVALDPRGGATAHRHLADLLELRGDRALALHHRALSCREGRPGRRPRLDFEWLSDEWVSDRWTQ